MLVMESITGTIIMPIRDTVTKGEVEVVEEMRDTDMEK